MQANTSRHRQLSVCLAWLILPSYVTIQIIFATIHGPTALLDTIHESYFTISANFYLYLQYFQQKNF